MTDIGRTGPTRFGTTPSGAGDAGPLPAGRLNQTSRLERFARLRSFSVK